MRPPRRGLEARRAIRKDLVSTLRRCFHQEPARAREDSIAHTRVWMVASGSSPWHQSRACRPRSLLPLILTGEWLQGVSKKSLTRAICPPPTPWSHHCTPIRAPKDVVVWEKTSQQGLEEWHVAIDMTRLCRHTSVPLVFVFDLGLRQALVALLWCLGLSAPVGQTQYARYRQIPWATTTVHVTPECLGRLTGVQSQCTW